MSKFQLVEGNTGPSIVIAITENGAYMDLTDATSVTMTYRLKDGEAGSGTTVTCSFADRETGRVQYDWQDGDTDVAGDYWLQWDITWSDGRIESYPLSATYKEMTIHPKLT